MANANAYALSSEAAKKAADMFGTFLPYSKKEIRGIFNKNKMLENTFLAHENKATTVLSSLPENVVLLFKQMFEENKTKIKAEMDILLGRNDPKIYKAKYPTLYNLKKLIQSKVESTQNIKKLPWYGGSRDYYNHDDDYDSDSDDDDDDQDKEGLYVSIFLKLIFCWLFNSKCDFKRNGGKGKKNSATLSLKQARKGGWGFCRGNNACNVRPTNDVPEYQNVRPTNDVPEYQNVRPTNDVPDQVEYKI